MSLFANTSFKNHYLLPLFEISLFANTSFKPHNYLLTLVSNVIILDCISILNFIIWCQQLEPRYVPECIKLLVLQNNNN